MEPKPDLSVLVVSYNTKDMTLECLRSIYRETRTTSFEIVVLDNASSDGSAEAIASQFIGVQLIAEKENFGFAEGNNRASKLAAGDFLLLLNPDTVILDGAIDKLMSFAKLHPDAGIWGGKTVYADRTLNPSSCWRRMSIWTIFCRTAGLASIFPNSSIWNSEAYGGWLRDSERAVDIVTGCFLLIRKADWERLTGFDRAFFMYGEEADLCLRARALGLRPMITPSATIVHYDGASEKNRAEKMIRLFSAKVLLIKRHFPLVEQPIGIFLLSLWPIVRIFSYWLASLLGPERFSEEKALWLRVWRERQTWQRGKY